MFPEKIAFLFFLLLWFFFALRSIWVGMSRYGGECHFLGKSSFLVRVNIVAVTLKCCLQHFPVSGIIAKTCLPNCCQREDQQRNVDLENQSVVEHTLLCSSGLWEQCENVWCDFLTWQWAHGRWNDLGRDVRGIREDSLDASDLMRSSLCICLWVWLIWRGWNQLWLVQNTKKMINTKKAAQILGRNFSTFDSDFKDSCWSFNQHFD